MTKLSGSISMPENMVEKILIKLLELLKKQILAFYIGMNIGRHISIPINSLLISKWSNGKEA